MPTIVDFPIIVKEALDVFGDLFATEPARQYFAEYVIGLMVAERKNVSGINREFAVTTDQSCLNRWLSSDSWDEKALNERRLEWLQPQLVATQIGPIAAGAAGSPTVVYELVSPPRMKMAILHDRPCHERRSADSSARSLSTV